ncbi:hypothetical protein S83_033469 [Arachis hypogaea]|nr:uncharacterized protein DS421_10g312630 [Arachis hypogaea]
MEFLSKFLSSKHNFFVKPIVFRMAIFLVAMAPNPPQTSIKDEFLFYKLSPKVSQHSSGIYQRTVAAQPRHIQDGPDITSSITFKETLKICLPLYIAPRARI